MKRIVILMSFALISSIAVNAQDSTSIKHKHKTHASHDSVPNPADSTKIKKWEKDKMPKEPRKNWPDSMGRAMPDSMKRPE